VEFTRLFMLKDQERSLSGRGGLGEEKENPVKERETKVYLEPVERRSPQRTQGQGLKKKKVTSGPVEKGIPKKNLKQVGGDGGEGC